MQWASPSSAPWWFTQFSWCFKSFVNHTFFRKIFFFLNWTSDTKFAFSNSATKQSKKLHIFCCTHIFSNFSHLVILVNWMNLVPIIILIILVLFTLIRTLVIPVTPVTLIALNSVTGKILLKQNTINSVIIDQIRNKMVIFYSTIFTLWVVDSLSFLFSDL